jgi:hypothetical protein
MTERTMNHLHQQVDVALKGSATWSEFTVGSDTCEVGLHLVIDRKVGDVSPELLIQYRHAVADAPEVVVHFTEQREDECNEGLHDLHLWTFNLLAYLNKQIPSFGFNVDKGVFVPVVKGHEMDPAHAWMFARD